MWDNNSARDLSRRERQVMEIIMRLGTATGREIEQNLPEAPTYSAVRSILRLLVEKNMLVKQLKDGRDHYQLPLPAPRARVKALQNLVRSFFENSVGEAALALLGDRKAKLTDQEADRLLKLIEEARKK